MPEDVLSVSEGVGDYLRHQREVRGFSLEEIAEQTKISLRALRALEAEDWEVLPAEIYIRGFIRCYCETIGLDPHEAIQRFEKSYRPAKPQESPLADEGTAPGWRRVLLWIAVAVALIFVVLLGYRFLFTGGETVTTLEAPAVSAPEEGAARQEAAPASQPAPPPAGVRPEETATDKPSGERGKGASTGEATEKPSRRSP